jgi:hypothetical protein
MCLALIGLLRLFIESKDQLGKKIIINTYLVASTFLFLSEQKT